MTSQTWRTAQEVDKPVWKHFIQIYRPANVKSNIALLWIDGGNNRGNKPNPNPLMLKIAQDNGVIVAELRQIPSEPLSFLDETNRPRNEDGIIAYTWEKYLKGGDDQWPLRLPMTKAGVRAMDTVTAYLKSQAGGAIDVNRFIVGGASKRGWTTWTVAAVDPRVVAIAPMVIDLLNIVPNFMHHYRVYGFWAPAIQDYVDSRIPDWFNTKRFQSLMKIEEPFEYRDRLTMPKLLINSAGDDFFVPDSSQFYYSKLKGENHIRYMPNTRHSLEPAGVAQSLSAFVDSIVNQKSRPHLSWKIDRKNGAIAVKTVEQPKEAKLWSITNPKARDFRLTTTGPQWKSEKVSLVKGRYVARVPKPGSGYTAFFVELSYENGSPNPHTFTTEVSIVPNVYPFPTPKPGDGLAPRN